jgi:hypothetical protein
LADRDASAARLQDFVKVWQRIKASAAEKDERKQNLSK